MTVEEIKRRFEKDPRSLEELVRDLIRRKAISQAVANWFLNNK